MQKWPSHNKHILSVSFFGFHSNIIIPLLCPKACSLLSCTASLRSSWHRCFVLLVDEVGTKSTQMAGFWDKALLIQLKCQGQKTVFFRGLINSIPATIHQWFIKKIKRKKGQAFCLSFLVNIPMYQSHTYYII